MRGTILKKSILVCLLIVTGCAQTRKMQTSSIPASYYQETLQDFINLTAGLRIPQYLQKGEPRRRDKEFDVMQYFDVLSHLSMESNYVLDYVYCPQGIGGQPFLYVRPISAPPFGTYQELFETYQHRLAQDAPKNKKQVYLQFYFDFLNYIRTDQTEEGFFELLILRMFAGKFYLYWHAGYYDVRIIPDNDSLEKLFAEDVGIGNPISERVKCKASKLRLTPQISLNTEQVRITFVSFTKWGGFFRETYDIQKDYPHIFLKESRKNVIKYDCGIQF